MKRKTLLLMSLLVVLCLYGIRAQDYTLESSSYYNDGSDSDAVKSAVILSDGTIVLAANSKNNYGKTPIVLNGASASSAGSIVRLSSDGTSILSITKVGNKVEDLSIDSNDNIYVALASQGFVKLNATASSLIYQKANNGYCGRIDVTPDGTVAALESDGRYPGKIHIYNSSGGVVTTFNGKNFSSDVAIDQASRLVFTIGFGNSHSGCNPVQVAYLRVHNFNGNQVWKNYDHSGTHLDTRKWWIVQAIALRVIPSRIALQQFKVDMCALPMKDVTARLNGVALTS